MGIFVILDQLGKVQRKRTIIWIGSILSATAIAIWGGYKVIHANQDDISSRSQENTKIESRCAGVSIGGSVNNSNILSANKGCYTK